MLRFYAPPIDRAQITLSCAHNLLQKALTEVQPTLTSLLPQAVLLVGGLGTRLRSVTGDLPKAMIKVSGMPFLERILIHLRSSEIEAAVLAVSHGRESIETHFRDGRLLGMAIAYSLETEPLGTAGALREALPLLRGAQVFVLNGDSFVDINYHEMIRFHRVQGNRLTIAAVEQSDCRDFGRLRISNGSVLAFAEKDHRDRSAGYINAGVYVVDRELIETIPPGVVQSLEKEVFSSILSAGGRIGAYCIQSYFMDLGTPERLQQLRTDFAQGLVPLRGVETVTRRSRA
jgi:NDP-sugar pyrophosphorylase family protein